MSALHSKRWWNSPLSVFFAHSGCAVKMYYISYTNLAPYAYNLVLVKEQNK